MAKLTPEEQAHHLGMLLENDYRWPWWAADPHQPEKGMWFNGGEERLEGLEVKTMAQTYPWMDIDSLPLSPELRRRVQDLDKCVLDVREAIRRKDLVAVNSCYARFGEIRRDVPYDAEKATKNW